MNAQRTKRLTTGCAHSNRKPGVPTPTTNISVRFAPDLTIHFQIEKSMNISIQNRPVGLPPRLVAWRRLTAAINKP
jgi:hypothetical protein